MEKQNSDWEITTNRFVAFFDILGFKDRVMRDSHDSIYSDLNELNNTFRILEDNYNLKKNDTEIHIVNFSDSIIFFSKSDTKSDFYLFIDTITHAFRKILEKNIPVKAGVAHGKISVNKENRVFFGQPMIDAFLMEEDVNYLGIVCHHSIDSYLKHETISNNKLIKKLTPLKSGKIVHTNVEWFTPIPSSKITIEKINNILRVYDGVNDFLENLYTTMSGSPRRYIDNTRDFYEKFTNN